MRSKLSLFGLLLVLGVINAMIATKERALDQGRTVILELAPADPRSLMQGDYMELQYSLARKLPESAPDQGVVYIDLDDRGVATGLSTRPLTGRTPLRYHRLGQRVLFDVESFFFQEGQGSFFVPARYGELRVDREGNPLLVGLLDDRLRRIEP